MQRIVDVRQTIRAAIVASCLVLGGCGTSEPPPPAAPADVEAAREQEEAQHAAEASHRAEP